MFIFFSLNHFKKEIGLLETFLYHGFFFKGRWGTSVIIINIWVAKIVSYSQEMINKQLFKGAIGLR